MGLRFVRSLKGQGPTCRSCQSCDAPGPQVTASGDDLGPGGQDYAAHLAEAGAVRLRASGLGLRHFSSRQCVCADAPASGLGGHFDARGPFGDRAAQGEPPEEGIEQLIRETPFSFFGDLDATF